MTRRSAILRWSGLAAVVLLATSCAGPAAPTPEPRVGINLAGAADWGTEQPFVDVFRMSRPWVSHREGADWGQGPPLAIDEHGWITRLEPGCSAETFLCSIGGGHYPGGDYTVLHDGEGTLEFAMAGVEVVARSPGRLVVRVEPARGAISVRLRATDPDDYLRNIRVLMPGFEETYREDPWHPGFLDRWRGVACLRFMDLMATNNSDQESWSDRPTVDDATFAEKGVPVELLVDLANRLDADPWFCMPHRAEDEYITNFAEIVRDGLRPGLRAWVEYSNEVWNGGFAQHGYAAERGRALGLASDPWQAACRDTADRSLAIFDLWERAFGGSDRIVRVLAAQAANAEVARQILGFRGAGRRADALAIAPYMGLIVPADPSAALNAGLVADWSVETVLDHVERVALPEAIRAVESHKAIADRHGLRLVAYEAGQHLVGVGGAEGNDRLTALLTAANRHPRMGDLYARYLDAWAAAGGDLICLYSSVSAWSQWGSWGLLEYADEDPAAAPKYAATARWAAAHGQPIGP